MTVKGQLTETRRKEEGWRDALVSLDGSGEPRDVVCVPERLGRERIVVAECALVKHLDAVGEEGSACWTRHLDGAD
jgi:hypothetical protein